jgi:glutathione S-transferase
MAKLSGGMVAWAERRINKAGEGAVRADLVNLPRHLDRIDRWLEEGVLGGEAPTAADLQVAAALRLLLTVGDLAPLIDARPAGAYARRVFPRYPGHVPAGALPAAWLPASQRS